MAQTITNQARINYQFNNQTGSALSNIATATLTDPLEVGKNVLESTYRAGDELTYVVSIGNTGAAPLTNVTVTDDLGMYTIETVDVTPLTYVPPAIYYVNGRYAGNLTATQNADELVFNIPSVAAGANVLIIYKAQVNEGARLDSSSQITNTVTVTADGITCSATATTVVDAEDYADVRITKTMSPANVADGSSITYEFDIFNYGNTEATNIVLIDQFEPAPANISAQINGDIVSPADYTYTGGLLTFPAGSSGLTLSLPAATVTQDPATGEVTVTPSAINITVTGVI